MNNRLQARLRTLEGIIPPTRRITYDDFSASWEGMDALSRSLYECEASTPALFDSDESRQISCYLKKMGHTVVKDDRSINDILNDE